MPKLADQLFATLQNWQPGEQPPAPPLPAEPKPYTPAPEPKAYTPPAVGDPNNSWNAITARSLAGRVPWYSMPQTTLNPNRQTTAQYMGQGAATTYVPPMAAPAPQAATPATTAPPPETIAPHLGGWAGNWRDWVRTLYEAQQSSGSPFSALGYWAGKSLGGETPELHEARFQDWYAGVRAFYARLGWNLPAW